MAKLTPKLEQRKDPKTGQLRRDNVPVLLDVVIKCNRLWLQIGIKTNRSFGIVKIIVLKPLCPIV